MRQELSEAKSGAGEAEQAAAAAAAKQKAAEAVVNGLEGERNEARGAASKAGKERGGG